MEQLPKTVSCKLYIELAPSGSVHASTGSMAEYGYTNLAVHNLTFDVPQDDPTAKIIEGLENRAEDIQAEAAAEVRLIMDKIASLRCIEHKPEAEQ